MQKQAAGSVSGVNRRQAHPATARVILGFHPEGDQHQKQGLLICGQLLVLVLEVLNDLVRIEMEGAVQALVAKQLETHWFRPKSHTVPVCNDVGQKGNECRVKVLGQPSFTCCGRGGKWEPKVLGGPAHLHCHSWMGGAHW